MRLSLCEREVARSCPQGARVQKRKLSIGCLVVPEGVGGSKKNHRRSKSRASPEGETLKDGIACGM